MQFLVTVSIFRPEAARPHMAAHLAYLQSAFAAGEIVAYGPFADHTGGWFIAEEPSLEAADTLIGKDPIARAEAAVYDVKAILVAQASEKLVRV